MTTYDASKILGRSEYWVCRAARAGRIASSYRPGCGYDHDEGSVRALRAQLDDAKARRHETYRADLIAAYQKIERLLPSAWAAKQYRWTPRRLAGYRLKYRDAHGGKDPNLQYWSGSVVELSDRMIEKTKGKKCSPVG